MDLSTSNHTFGLSSSLPIFQLDKYSGNSSDDDEEDDSDFLRFMSVVVGQI